jgi:hypothetical protein
MNDRDDDDPVLVFEGPYEEVLSRSPVVDSVSVHLIAAS